MAALAFDGFFAAPGTALGADDVPAPLKPGDGKKLVSAFVVGPLLMLAGAAGGVSAATVRAGLFSVGLFAVVSGAVDVVLDDMK